ncbi:rod shape-determining protein MreD [Candidatus Erwinia haradaeae]|nr:rod shape-determining protein MreD [Candidatus Erwinia haradaeae]
MWLSFLVAIILQIIPYPENLLLFRPSWLLLVMINWVLIFPHQSNFSISFIIGLITDLMYGSTLGIHSLAFSIITYLVVCKNYQFNHYMLWQQALLIIGLSWIINIVVFLLEYFVIRGIFCPEYIFSSIINGILWPWLHLLMNKIFYKYSIR